MISAIYLSLKISIVSTFFSLLIGIILSKIFITFEFKLKRIIETFFLLPLVLPPSIVGYLLLMMLGRNGILSKIFHINIIFTWYSAVIASLVVSFPIMYQNCKTAFLEIDREIIKSAMTLGTSNRRIFFFIELPLAKRGIISGIILSFMRAVGEFGATLMVAGNIPGKTQTIPLAIYQYVEMGKYKVANILVIIVLCLGFFIIFFVNTERR
jgi:molybdate transport system permease protein